MDLFEVPRSEKRKSFLTALVLAMVVMLVAAPVSQATHGHTQNVKVKGAATVKPQGGRFDSKPITEMGLFQAVGSSGALAVRNYAGGGGVLAVLDCTAGVTQDGPLANTATVSGDVVTGILATGTDGMIVATSPAVGGGNVQIVKIRVGANNPNEFIGLGNGLTLTAPLTFTGTAQAGGDGDCQVVVFGQTGT